MSSLIYHRLKASRLCFSSCHPSCGSKMQEGDQKGPLSATRTGRHPPALSVHEDFEDEITVSCLYLCIREKHSFPDLGAQNLFF